MNYNIGDIILFDDGFGEIHKGIITDINFQDIRVQIPGLSCDYDIIPEDIICIEDKFTDKIKEKIEDDISNEERDIISEYRKIYLDILNKEKDKEIIEYLKGD